MTTNQDYRQCSLSVMDTIADPDITFDEKGICNYYYEYQKAAAEKLFPDPEMGWKALEELADRIKEEGRGKPYDCIMGLSGGVDSTYVAWLAHQLGLRPLAVHFDNGWNSELAVKNIENIVSRLGLDLHTNVIDWEEFRDLQLAYLKASVVDIEAITDHAIFASLYRIAGEKNIKYILSGTNVQTEQTMPRTWNFSKSDHRNIKAIHKAYGKVPLKTFPFMDAKVKRYYMGVKGVQSLSVLHYVPYIKKEVKALIAKELGWKDYGGKHFESLFTRFYQGYILPAKFGIDKRKPHLSNLIFSGQMTKAEALEELAKPIYDEILLKHDMDFVLKKLGLNHEEFEKIMKLPVRSHYDFDYEMPVDKRYPVLAPVKKIYRKIRPVKR
ncbi:MAG: N-acetyl sugar amidotransferase [Chitinophagaceae bacterium]|nr:N-acetyl sugar amidotransferase [Chitinophagaceae bacterium]